MTSSRFGFSRRLRPLVAAGAMLLTAGTATATSSDDRDDAAVLTGAAEVIGYFGQVFPIEPCAPGA